FEQLRQDNNLISDRIQEWIQYLECIAEEAPLMMNLLEAIRLNSVNTIETLIDSGVDLNQRIVIHIFNKGPIRSLTPLHSAILNNNPEIVKFLIANGADINALTDQWDTPLHLAIREKNLDIINLLIQSDANFCIININGKTIFHEAIDSKNLSILQVLLKHGSHWILLCDSYGAKGYIRYIPILDYTRVCLALYGAPEEMLKLVNQAYIEGDIEVLQWLQTYLPRENPREWHEIWHNWMNEEEKQQRRQQFEEWKMEQSNQNQAIEATSDEEDVTAAPPHLDFDADSSYGSKAEIVQTLVNTYKAPSEQNLLRRYLRKEFPGLEFGEGIAQFENLIQEDEEIYKKVLEYHRIRQVQASATFEVPVPQTYSQAVIGNPEAAYYFMDIRDENTGHIRKRKIYRNSMEDVD
ncbi:MAG: ankyrin repeat domain-containing protein, partial [Ignavibacteria bacterium]|nr:ankyrin repeat domain-containing protein [Ignavibacteria bacterium]